MPMTLSRSVLTVLIPGLIAICPWLLAIVQYTSATLGFDKYTTLANALVFCAAAVVGSICERIGTSLESRWDKERDGELQVSDQWYTYLAHTLDKEPVGFRYLSRLVTSLYFELGMFVAGPSFVAGVTVLASLRFPEWSVILGIVGLALVVCAGFFFHGQARDTHLLLCRTRVELNRRLAR
ncbi:hypothetical protein GOY17_03020 [Lysobacter soli]|uniref:hypothetical protein n=1 Tax=Lysobacter soli TaxID=453783 RepID=UPI0012EDAA57|nr:hypothetical protein [Lysobacter soli]QGW63979.1 hypothetical protein GOY17_03020 [Lysobacter soli]